MSIPNAIPLIEDSATASPIISPVGPATAVLPDKVIGSSSSFEVYEPFRNLLTKRETEYSLILAFFNDKHAVESSYIKENEKLLKKYSTLNLSNGKSTSLALSSFMEFTAAQHEERLRYRDQIQIVTTQLEDLKKAIDSSTKQLKEVVKPVARKFTDMSSIVPKIKNSYTKKLESWERESADTTISGQKLFKINKDAEVSDLTYRTAIVELEDLRISLEHIKQKASVMWEVMERQRGEFISNCLRQLSTSLNDSQSRQIEKLNAFSLSAESINFEEDCKLAVDYFLLAFPERDPVLFEHYKTKEGAKDLIFGVSLEHALRTTSKDGIPFLLHYCFDAIEKRGLEKEGIYRISPKKLELAELKAKVETNVHAIQYMCEDLDIHLLAGLVKLYLREMPAPLFLFSTKDRAEYSANANVEERIAKLTTKVNALSKESKTLLEAIITHLNRVYMKCSINKMTIPNLSIVFSPCLFQGQEQAALEPASITSIFFGGRGLSATIDTSALAMLKSDLLVEDMIKHSKQIFKGAPYSVWKDISGTTASMLQTSPAKDELPQLPHRDPSNYNLKILLHDIPGASPTVSSNDEPIAASPESSQMAPSRSDGTQRASRSFFGKLGSGVGLTPRKIETPNFKNIAPPLYPYVVLNPSLQEIGTIENDSPLSGEVDVAKRIAAAPDNENAGSVEIRDSVVPGTTSVQHAAPLGELSTPRDLRTFSNDNVTSTHSLAIQDIGTIGNDSPISGAVDEKDFGQTFPADKDNNMAPKAGHYRSSEGTQKVPNHFRSDNHSIMSFKSTIDNTNTGGPKGGGALMKDKVLNLFKRLGTSSDDLKPISTDISISGSNAGPYSAPINGPDVNVNVMIHTKSKSSISESLPHMIGPEYVSTPLSSILDDVFMGLAAPSIYKDPKKLERDDDDDNYIDESLLAEVNSNLSYQMLHD